MVRTASNILQSSFLKSRSRESMASLSWNEKKQLSGIYSRSTYRPKGEKGHIKREAELKLGFFLSALTFTKNSHQSLVLSSYLNFDTLFSWSSR